MEDEGFPKHFINFAIRTAKSYEGIDDLLQMWYREKDSKERQLIEEDIQKLLNELSRYDRPKNQR